MQAWECTAAKELSWNMLSLFTESGMLLLEVSLLAFLLQGNHAGGLEVLTRTFVVSGVIVAADTLLKVINVVIPKRKCFGMICSHSSFAFLDNLFGL